MTKTRNRGRAGGYNIVQGCHRFPNFHPGQRLPWIKATRTFINRKLKANDWTTKLMVAEAERDLGSLYARPMHIKNGTPLERAQAIIGNIVKQGKQPRLLYESTWNRRRATPLDVLIAALATDIMFRHWEGTPLRSPTDAWRRPYFRAVQIGKAIYFMLRYETKVYEQDSGHGNIRRTVIKQKLGLTSRYVCQRLQGITEAMYGDFMKAHGGEIASLVARSEIERKGYCVQDPYKRGSATISEVCYNSS
jgi:hypothetical protein